MIKTSNDLEQALQTVRSVPLKDWVHYSEPKTKDEDKSTHYLTAGKIAEGQTTLPMPFLNITVNSQTGLAEAVVLHLPNDLRVVDNAVSAISKSGSGKLCTLAQEILNQVAPQLLKTETNQSSETQAEELLRNITTDQWKLGIPDNTPQYSPIENCVVVGFLLEELRDGKGFADLYVTVNIFSGARVGDAEVIITCNEDDESPNLKAKGGFVNKIYDQIHASRRALSNDKTDDGPIPALPKVNE